MKHTLRTLIKGKPDLIQFAKDGKYEEAWIIKRTASQPSKQDMVAYLSKADYTTLAVEYFWNSDNGEKHQVVTIIHNSNIKAKKPLDFMTLSFDIFYAYTTFPAFVDFFDTAIIGFPFLFKVPLDLVRVGVVNHWFSVGPIDIWKKGELVDRTLLANRLATNPNVTTSKLNYQAAAFIFNFDKKLPGPYHIFHTPCGQKVEGKWRLNTETLLRDLTEHTERFHI